MTSAGRTWLAVAASVSLGGASYCAARPLMGPLAWVGYGDYPPDNLDSLLNGISLVPVIPLGLIPLVIVITHANTNLFWRWFGALLTLPGLLLALALSLGAAFFFVTGLGSNLAGCFALLAAGIAPAAALAGGGFSLFRLIRPAFSFPLGKILAGLFLASLLGASAEFLFLRWSELSWRRSIENENSYSGDPEISLRMELAKFFDLDPDARVYIASAVAAKGGEGYWPESVAYCVLFDKNRRRRKDWHMHIRLDHEPGGRWMLREGWIHGDLATLDGGVCANPERSWIDRTHDLPTTSTRPLKHGRVVLPGDPIPE